MNLKYSVEKNTNYKYNNDLVIQEVFDGTLIPLEKNRSYNSTDNYYGGVYDEMMNLLPLSLNSRVSPPNFEYNFNQWYSGYNTDTFSYSKKTENINVIFLGAFHPHFGHFILESISRLWIFLESSYSDFEYVYISEKDISIDYLKLIQLFGIDISKLRRITEPTTFSRIIIPEMSLCLHSHYHLNYKKIINKITEKIPSIPSNKIYYLSRRNIKNSRVFGEITIEYILKKLNVEFIYPESLSIIDLIHKLKSCKKIIAISGTNSHNSIFMQEKSNLICLNRSQHYHPPQSMIDDFKNLNTLYIDVFLFSKVDWSSGPFYLYPTKHFHNWISAEFKQKIKINPSIFLQVIFEFLKFLYINFKNSIIKLIYK
jgi:hypothetical protein